MSTCVALVRGINVGGRNRVAMTDLRRLGERLAFQDVRTLLQSGNLVFHSDAQDTAAIERRLEQEAVKHLGLKTAAFFVRTAEEWAALVKRNPFRDEAERDPSHLLAVLRKEAAKPASIAALRAAIEAMKAPERFEVRGRDAYIFYPAGIGRAKLTPALVEKHLAGPGTARNWNTVLKLLELVRG
jgi:uncharacterized protein (DUF1697 family)